MGPPTFDLPKSYYELQIGVFDPTKKPRIFIISVPKIWPIYVHFTMKTMCGDYWLW